MTEKTLAVDGLMVRWEEAGEDGGMPTILIHGFPTTPRLWRNVVRRLEGARIIAWEMIGYGGSISVGKERDLSLPAQADYLAAAMRAAGIPGAVVAGHDLGGGVAQILAVRHPELVKGIVLINSVAMDFWPDRRVRRLKTLASLIRHLPNGLVKSIVRRSIRRGHSEAHAAAESFREHWGPYEKVDAGLALSRQLQALNPADTIGLAEAIARAELPARIVWGAHDPYHRLEHAHRLSTTIRAPLDVVDGAKHFVPEDFADRAAAAINSLIRELSAPGARPSQRHAMRSSGRSTGSAGS